MISLALAFSLAAIQASSTTPVMATQVVPATTAVPADQTTAALALARVLNSEATIIGDEQSDAAAIAMVPKLAEANTQLAALEGEHPGLLLALAKEMMPIVNRSARERLPELHRRQARLFAESFTASELQSLLDFYASPTGQKMITLMMANLRPDAMLAEAAKSPDMKVGAESALKDIQATVPSIVAKLDASDEPALRKLMASGLLPRLKELAPRTQTIGLNWMNETTPQEETETNRVMEAVLARYVKTGKP